MVGRGDRERQREDKDKGRDGREESGELGETTEVICLEFKQKHKIKAML